MCHNFVKHLLSYTLLLSTGVVASAQTTEGGSNPLSNRQNSPYSRYGIGDLRNATNISLRGMGNVSSPVADKYIVNAENPASYASLSLTTYEAGGDGNSSLLQTNGKVYQTGMATLSYLTIGIPMGKYMGMAFGLRPISRVYYNVQDSAYGNSGIPGIGDALRIYFGDGSVQQGYIGFAGKVGGFSAGFNFGYTFGNIRNTSALFSLSDTGAFNTDISRYTRIGGISWKFGALYAAKLNAKTSLNIGATVSLSQNLNATRDEYWISNVVVSGASSYDTVLKTAGAKGVLVMPFTYSIGAQLAGTDKWRAGVDFASANWGQFRNFGAADSLQESTYRLSLGGEYTPDAGNLRRYFQRVSYRLGFYYGSDYVRIRNTDLNYYAVTFGASLPFRRSSDRIHTAFEIGSRGTQNNGLIRENFVKFSLGISLNAFVDRWFVKRKYE